MTNRVYNLKKQIPDQRDFKVQLLEAVKLPILMTLHSQCPPIYDQGNLGSCTANAGVAARVMLNKLTINLSRLFQYYQERVIEGDVPQDNGAQMRDIGKAMLMYGVCEESYDPYNIYNFATAPSQRAITNALNYKIKSYNAVTSITQIKQTLALQLKPVLSGIYVFESFESAAVASTGKVPMPLPSEQLLGGHAILIIGYNDDKRWFVCRNSWGSSWGDHGYFYLPYTFFTAGYAFDWWILNN
jgi:C1A family cysteine protease